MITFRIYGVIRVFYVHYLSIDLKFKMDGILKGYIFYFHIIDLFNVREKYDQKLRK